MALVAKLKAIERERAAFPSRDEMDGSYRRLKYIRYADDFIIGIIGSKEDAKRVKGDIKNFLADRLALELSEEKTLITHTGNSAKFLGYEIAVTRDNHQKTGCVGATATLLRQVCPAERQHGNAPGQTFGVRSNGNQTPSRKGSLETQTPPGADIQ